MWGYDYDKDVLENNSSLYGSGESEFKLKLNGKIFAIIELKGTSTNLDNDKNSKGETPVLQGWRYARDNGPAPWFVVSNYNEVRLYNYHKGSERYVKFNFSELKELDSLKKFLTIFSKDSFLNNIPNILLDKTLVVDKDFEDSFYNLYSETRLMIMRILNIYNKMDDENSVKYAQLIMNRFMFIVFAEDIGLLPPEISRKTINGPITNHKLSNSKNSIWNDLNYLFIDIDEGNDLAGISGFNGGLFKERLDFIIIPDIVDNKSLLDNIKKDWNFENEEKEIKDLLGDYITVINPIFRNMLIMSRFNFTDKSDETKIDLNILGHIFENSLCDIEDLINKKDNKKDKKRSKHGIFYTHDFITDYICRNTIISYLSKSGKVNDINKLIKEYEDIQELDDKLANIKILDPACGSGAFLNKAVDILLEVHKSIHKFRLSEHIVEDSKNQKNKNKNDKTVQYSLDKWNDKQKRREIIINNIYGLDLIEESVEITKLSLFLKIATKKQKLPDLDSNIKCRDSLFNDNKLVDNKSFVWGKDFKEVFDEGGFDIIVGNPPYVTVSNMNYNKDQKKYLKNNYKSAVKKYNLYVLFMELSLSLLKDKGQLSFIIPKPFLSQEYAKEMRKICLKNTRIYEFFDLSKFDIFDDAKVDNIIFIIEKNEDETLINNNKIHIKRQLLDPHKFPLTKDYSLINQDIFNVTYQNMFRLELDNKQVYEIINKIVQSTTNKLGDVVFSSWGARGSPIKDFHFDHKINDMCKKLIKGTDIDRFNLNYSSRWLLYDLDKLYRPSMKEFFESEKIMLSKVTGNEGLIATYDNYSFYADDSVICITSKCYFKNLDTKILGKHRLKLTEEDVIFSSKVDLRYILALINSNLMNFYFKMMIGYDLNVYPNNILALPFINIDKKSQKEYINLVDSLIDLNRLLNKEKKEFIEDVLIYEFGVKEQLSNKLENYFDYFDLFSEITNETRLLIKESEGNVIYSAKINEFIEEKINLHFKEFIEEIKNNNGIVTKRSRKELLRNELKDSLTVIFNDACCINFLEEELNNKVYNLFNLNKEDKQVIERILLNS